MQPLTSQSIQKGRRPVPAEKLVRVPALYPGAFFTVHPDDPRAKGAKPVENKAAPAVENKADKPAKGKRRPKASVDTESDADKADAPDEAV